jgi:pyruvate,water dikinase
MTEKTARFEYPREVLTPSGLDGWEEMYPAHYLFSRERDDWEKSQFWYADRLHAPDPMPPLDLIFFEGWQIALSQNNTRVYCLPTAQGIAHRVLGCYVYITPANPPLEGWED